MADHEYEKPRLSEPEVRAAVEEAFHLRVDRLEPLPGDRSQNFLIRDEAKKGFVLKISSGFDREDELDFENRVMLLLSRKFPRLSFPVPLPSKAGSLISPLAGKNGRSYRMRLLTYVEGRDLSDADSIPESFWRELGRTLAAIDFHLKDFRHPGQRRRVPWDITNVLWAKDRLAYVGDASKRRRLDYALLQYETRVWPLSRKLRKQVIYGDANEHNFIVESSSRRTIRLKGLIDFGDMAESFLVNEPAVALTYALMKSSQPEKTAFSLLSSYHSIVPLKNDELDILYELVLARLVISLTMAAWRKHSEPDNIYMTVSEKPGWRLLDHLLSRNPEHWRRLFYRACGVQAPRLSLPGEKVLATRTGHVSAALSLAYRRPLHLVKGCGQYLFDSEGRTYLDCVNNVCHLGHCHPAVVRAVSRQMSVLNTNTRYLYDQLALYVEKLLAKFPKHLNYCFLVNSGSEANDLALRLARNFTGGSELLVIDGAYHGNLTSLVEISPYKFDGPGGKGAPSYVHKTPTPDPYRGKYRGNTVETSEKYAAEVARTIDRIRIEGKRLVGMIAESMMGCAGQVIFPPEFLNRAFQAVKAAGGVCIADEVQVGFGRPGRFFWGFESQNALPDIVTLGKPIGNGHPLGAVITTEEIARAFETGMEYFNTFGGNPVSCAAGLAVLDAVEEENLQENARAVGDDFLKELKKLQKKRRLVGHVRGLGLFLGVELVADRRSRQPATREAQEVVEKMRSRGILLSTDGPFRNVIKIKPPLVFSRDNVKRVVSTLDHVLKTYD